MKITRKKLENIIKEELSILLEQGFIDGQPVTIGGQQVTREELIKTNFDKIDKAVADLTLAKEEIQNEILGLKSQDTEDELTVNRYSNELSLLEKIKNRANSVSPLINSLAE